jgi:hypothetical protein
MLVFVCPTEGLSAPTMIHEPGGQYFGIFSLLAAGGQRGNILGFFYLLAGRAYFAKYFAKSGSPPRAEGGLRALPQEVMWAGAKREKAPHPVRLCISFGLGT